MQLTDRPDRVIQHEPGCCAGCGMDLSGAEETGVERRQVTEIPPAEVTEHQMIERECGGCGTRTRGKAPVASQARSPAFHATRGNGRST
jgi:transposase